LPGVGPWILEAAFWPVMGGRGQFIVSHWLPCRNRSRTHLA
jgi:hypothetical protein